MILVTYLELALYVLLLIANGGAMYHRGKWKAYQHIAKTMNEKLKEMRNEQNV